MADKPTEKRSWLPRWSRWKQPLQRVGLAAVGIVPLLTGFLLWNWTSNPDGDRVYEVYARTTYAHDDTSATAEDMRLYLTESFPPSEYEYIGIIAQRFPTSQSPSTTTYVLFRRK